MQDRVWPAAVAPVRERGLKSPARPDAMKTLASRSREGAWIEIDGDLKQLGVEVSLP